MCAGRIIDLLTDAHDEHVKPDDRKASGPARQKSEDILARRFPEFPVGTGEEVILLNKLRVCDLFRYFGAVQFGVCISWGVNTRVEIAKHCFVISPCKKTDKEENNERENNIKGE